MAHIIDTPNILTGDDELDAIYREYKKLAPRLGLVPVVDIDGEWQQRCTCGSWEDRDRDCTCDWHEFDRPIVIEAVAIDEVHPGKCVICQDPKGRFFCPSFGDYVEHRRIGASRRTNAVIRSIADHSPAEVN